MRILYLSQYFPPEIGATQIRAHELARGRFEVVYASSPPLFVGGAGVLVSILRRIPFYFEVRDLWPEAAVQMGELKLPWAIKMATWLEDRCYVRARRITVTTQAMNDRLVERDIPEEKLILIRNGANIELFRPDEATRKKVRNRLGLDGKSLVLYAGTLGLAYDLVALMDVAGSVSSNSDIHFLLIGDGPISHLVRNRAAELALTNVTFLSARPLVEIPGYFCAADVAVVPYRKPQLTGAFSVKIYDSMACAVPVIVAAGGEVRDIVEQNKAGIVTEPGDYEALTKAIRKLCADPILRAEFGNNGRLAATEKFSRQAQARQLVTLLEESKENGG